MPIYYLSIGLTPASEELKKLREEGSLELQADEEGKVLDDDDIYDSVESGDLGLD